MLNIHEELDRLLRRTEAAEYVTETYGMGLHRREGLIMFVTSPRAESNPLAEKLESEPMAPATVT